MWSAVQVTFNAYDGQKNISATKWKAVGGTVTLRYEASVTFDDKRFTGWRDTGTGFDYTPGAAYIVPDHDVRFEALFESFPNSGAGETETEERPSRRVRRKSDSSSTSRESTSRGCGVIPVPV